jgi:hypothetical protein
MGPLMRLHHIMKTMFQCRLVGEMTGIEKVSGTVDGGKAELLRATRFCMNIVGLFGSERVELCPYIYSLMLSQRRLLLWYMYMFSIVVVHCP